MSEFVAGGTHGEILERPRVLDVGECCLELLQLHVDLLRRLLCLRHLSHARPTSAPNFRTQTQTHRLALKRLDRLHVRRDVVRDGLELAEQLLRVVDDGGVLQHGAVVRGVDGGRLRAVVLREALGLAVSLAEGLQRGDGLCGRRREGAVRGGTGREVPFPSPREV